MKAWEKTVRRVCTGVLLFAVATRLAGTGSAKGSDGAAAFLLYLQTGRAVSNGNAPTAPTAAPEPSAAPDPTEPAETVSLFSFPTAPEPGERLTFSASEAEGVEMKYAGEYRPDLGALLEAPVELDFSGDEPRILILHTHTTESYTQAPGWEYSPSGEYRTLEEGANMLRVGEQMAQQLRQAGLSVLHDTELHDYPSYNGSYDHANGAIAAYLEEYPSIQMVIDVHRDAAELPDGSQMATSATVDGQPSAQVMLVMGTDEGGLYHPDWQRNLSWGLKLQVQAQRMYPGLVRPLSLRVSRFNQHFTPGSCLLEVGTAGNTMEEALRAADAFCQVLIQTIDGLGLRG